MKRMRWFMMGAAAGSAAAYLFDSANGSERREKLMESISSVAGDSSLMQKASSTIGDMGMGMRGDTGMTREAGQSRSREHLRTATDQNVAARETKAM